MGEEVGLCRIGKYNSILQSFPNQHTIANNGIDTCMHAYYMHT